MWLSTFVSAIFPLQMVGHAGDDGAGAKQERSS